MKNNDELQFTPMMRGEVGSSRMNGRIVYTDTNDFKTTNVKHNGNKKGVTFWNPKKMAYLMIIGGAVFAISTGSIKAFKTMSGSPKEPIAIEQTVDAPEEIEVKKIEQNRVVVDYLVKSGDTLDGIIYKYTNSANEKDYYKNFVTFYNNIDDDVIKMGQVITLVGVPEEYADDLNTGYNASVDNNDEISVQLNEAVKEMLDEVGEDYAKGSLVDTVVKELEVYNQTTNAKTRSNLAKNMLNQIESVKVYGNDESYEMDKGKGR